MIGRNTSKSSKTTKLGEFQTAFKHSNSILSLNLVTDKFLKSEQLILIESIFKNKIRKWYFLEKRSRIAFEIVLFPEPDPPDINSPPISRNYKN
jgi:hypothetical protein